MLFALVPLNNLSSSFTRNDGITFDGMPGTRSASECARATHFCRGMSLRTRDSGADSDPGEVLPRTVGLTQISLVRWPADGGFSIVDSFTFNGETTTPIDTRYGGTCTATAPLLPRPTVMS